MIILLWFIACILGAIAAYIACELSHEFMDEVIARFDKMFNKED
jgi:hypothetical protein